MPFLWAGYKTFESATDVMNGNTFLEVRCNFNRLLQILLFLIFERARKDCNNLLKS